MREILINIFKDDTFGPDITLFGFFHLFYFFIIIGITLLLIFLFKDKEESKKKKLLDIYAIILVCLYFGDFFVHPFMNNENALNVDKLPFHLCTIACPLIAIIRIFPDKTKRIANAVTVLGLVGAIMYLTCPNGAVGPGVKAFSYRMLQTFTYHGVLFTYGILSLALGANKLDYKKIYIEAIMIACLVLISLGANHAYAIPGGHHYDWFFTTGSSFGVNEYAMPFIMFGIIFAMCNAIYLIYFGIKKLIEKKKASDQELAEDATN